MIAYSLALCVALIILGLVTCNSQLERRKLNSEKLKKNIQSDSDVNREITQLRIIDLFEDIYDSILQNLDQEYKKSKFYQFFLCILSCAILFFSSFLFEYLQGKNQSNDNLFLFSAFILIILTILITLFIYIYKSIEKKIRNYDNALIICSYQRTALLTAIQLDDKEMISKNLANLAGIDQSFFSEKKSDFE